ncbi:MAG: hypothetical protein JEY96_01820 [Bacteroidales bacterium]|jgi:hypothetical protein|nr:hypothetical protein [Bacteroidales bacterium]
MASCRDIKKDVNFLAVQMMSECFSFLEYSPLNNQENVLDILHDVEQLRLNLLYKINHPKDNANLRMYYRQVITQMYQDNMELLERLNSLSGIE